MSDKIIDNAYKLIKPIGQGGMATVYLAEVDISKVNYTLLYAYTQVNADSHSKRVELAEELALKLQDKKLDWETIRNLLEAQNIPVPPQKVALKLAHQGIKPERFEDEWKYLICLNHPNVIKVFGGGTHNGRPYYTMELVPGIVSHKEIIEKFTVEQKLKVIFGAGKGLSFLHKNKIIHRDIKPDNFISVKNKKGQLITKVTDLGLAKDTEASLGMTGSASVLGTPYFMSPEQMKSARDVDHRADIYSLGASLYEFMTGKKPFHQKTSLVEILKTAIESESPIAPERHVEGFPDKLSGILRCSMALEPKDRYETMDHFLKDLRTFIETSHGALATSMNVSVEVSGSLDTASTFLFETKSRALEKSNPKKSKSTSGKKAGAVKRARNKSNNQVNKSSKTPLLIGAGAVFALMLGVIIILLFKESTPRTEEPSTQSSTLATQETPQSSFQTKEKGEARRSSFNKSEESSQFGEPIIHYMFDEEHFQKYEGKLYVTDQSGNENDGFIYGAKLTNGISKGGIDFPIEKDGYLKIPTSESTALKDQEGLTISIWANIKKGKRGGKNFLVKGNGFGLIYNYQGHHIVKMSAAGITSKGKTPNWDLDEEWHHYVGTYNPRTSTVRVYIDGVLDGEIQGQNEKIENSDIWVMNGGKHMSAFHGSLDELIIWKRCLGKDEVLSLYESNNNIQHELSFFQTIERNNDKKNMLFNYIWRSTTGPTWSFVFKENGTGEEREKEIKLRDVEWKLTEEHLIISRPGRQWMYNLPISLNGLVGANGAGRQHPLKPEEFKGEGEKKEGLQTPSQTKENDIESTLLNNRKSKPQSPSQTKANDNIKNSSLVTLLISCDGSYSVHNQDKVVCSGVGRGQVHTGIQIDLNKATLKVHMESESKRPGFAMWAITKDGGLYIPKWKDVSPGFNRVAFEGYFRRFSIGTPTSSVWKNNSNIFPTCTFEKKVLSDRNRTVSNIQSKSSTPQSPAQTKENDIEATLPLANMEAISPDEAKELILHRWPWATVNISRKKMLYVSLSDKNKGPEVKDISILKGMPISDLRISGTQVKDLSPLIGSNLERLEISGTKVTDLSPLKGLPIGVIRLNSLNISDLSSLAKCPLVYLEAPSTNITSLEGLPYSTLKDLRISGTQVKDLSPLIGSNLERLEISGTKVTDLSPLKGLPIGVIRLNSLNISDLSSLAKCPLVYLEAPSTNITSLEGLPYSTLKDLRISGTQVKDLSPLIGSNLERLEISGTKVTDLSPLKGLPIGVIRLNSLNISDLSPLAKCPLVYLEAPSTNITSLEGLPYSTLKDLRISGTQIKDLSPLIGSNLERLEISGTKVVDFSPLKGLPLNVLRK